MCGKGDFGSSSWPPALRLGQGELCNNLVHYVVSS